MKRPLPLVARFLKRLVIATVVVIAFFVVTQDLQVFPCLLSSFRETPPIPPAFVDESRIETVDGESIVVWRVAAQGEQKGIVVFLHGNGDTRATGVNVQQMLARRGLSSYSFDYRGVAGSSGWPTEQGIYRDGEAVVDYAAKREGIEARELIIFGFSVGTGPAAYLAKRYQVATVVLVSPYLRFDTLVSEMPLFGYLTPFLKYRFPTIEHLKETTHTRIIIAHGTTDVIVPYSHTERLQAALDGSHTPLVFRFEGNGHNDILPVAIEPLFGAALESVSRAKPKQSRLS